MKALIFLVLFLPSIAFADVSVPRAKQYLWTTYDVSVLGGASTPGSQRAINLGAILPAGAILTNMWVYINTQFAATGTESLGITCTGAASAPDLMAFTSVKNIAADRMLSANVSGSAFTGAAALIPASPTQLNLSQGFGSVPADCAVSAVIQGNSGFTPYTAGSATVIVEFFRK